MPRSIRRRLVLLMLVVAGCVYGASFYRPPRPVSPHLGSGPDLAAYGPAPRWRGLAALKPVAPEHVAWLEMALEAAGLQPAGLPSEARLAVVRFGSSAPPEACRQHLLGMADRIEGMFAESGTLPTEPDWGDRCGCGGQVEYRVDLEDYELQCSRSRLRYTSLEGFRAEQRPGQSTAILLQGVHHPGGVKIGETTVIGLDPAGLSAHRDLLEAISQRLSHEPGLAFHLAQLDRFCPVEGRLQDARLELEAWSAALKPAGSRESILNALSALPSEAAFAAAVDPRLAEQAHLALDNLWLELSPAERRHLGAEVQRLAHGAVGMAAPLELAAGSELQAMRQLCWGRVPRWVAFPAGSSSEGSRWLAGSPVLWRHRDNLLSRIHDGRVQLSFGGGEFQPAISEPEDLLVGSLPGDPAAAGWLRWSDARQARKLRWAAGVRPGSLWLVVESQPAALPEVSAVPDAAADRPDPEAATDPTLWE